MFYYHSYYAALTRVLTLKRPFDFGIRKARYNKDLWIIVFLPVHKTLPIGYR